jgi:predicted dehydrogenase
MKTPQKPVRIGVIGCGSVASGPYTGIIEQMRFHGHAEVVVACDIVAEKAKRLAANHGITRVTRNAEDVINADDVDITLITTSMNEHGPLAMAALKAGKHVLVEKPMSTDLKEAGELVKLSKKSRGHLICAPHIVLSRTYQEMWRRIKRGEIGTPFNARARYGWHPGPWWGQWFFQKGGGALFDLGVYNVTALSGLLGSAKRVTAMTGVAVPTRKVEGKMMKTVAEDNAHVLIDYGNSVFAVVTTGFTMPSYRSPCIEIYGSGGVIQMLGDDWAPEGLEQFNPKTDSWQVQGNMDHGWSWTDGLRHLVDCIRNNKTPITKPEHAYHALEIMLAAQAAGADGQAREIKSNFPALDFAEKSGKKSKEAKHDRTRKED